MASKPEPWSLSHLFRKRLTLPKTRNRTVSGGSPGIPKLRTHKTAGSLPGPSSASVSMINLAMPSSDVSDAGNSSGTVAWQILSQALHRLESSLGVFPPLKGAVRGLVSCMEHVELAQRNQIEYRRLASDLTNLVGKLQSHLPESRPARMPYSVSNVARAIEDHTVYLKRKYEKCMVVGFVMTEEDSEDLDVSLSTWSLTHEQWVDARLKDLAPAHDAYYNSTLSMEMQRRGCTENTRQEVLGDMRNWTRDPNAASIYWMNGMAGTGKSTIAYSLCEQLEEDNQLGASFFCSRNSPDCRDVSRIVPTIAYQLGRYSNPYQAALCEVLGNNTDVARRKIDVQFKKLILEPLMKIEDTLPQDVVIVIDALDECADSNGMRLVLDLVFRHATELPVRFFITSRPEPVISSKIMQPDPTPKSILHLHDIEKSLVQADIQAYLTEALAPIKPDSRDIERLAARAGCLFIFAATVVRYIAPTNPSVDHDERLATMLNATSTTEQGRYKDVDDLYSTILSKALEDETFEKSETKKRQLVLWTVVCAREPLNAFTLAQLLNIGVKRKLETALEPLRSVLHVSETNGVVSTLHASFPDFLLNAKRAGRFACDKINHDKYLASQSFRVMEKQLRFNICELQSSYLLDGEVSDLDSRIEEAIPTGLLYACRYWGDHLSQARASPEMTNPLDNFLRCRILFWMEVLNLKGWMGHAENILTQVLIWLPKNDDLAELHQFLYDARNFMTAFTTSAVSQSTPHIYLSALPFTSKQSQIWINYWPLTQGLMKVEGALMSSRGKSALASWSTGSPVGRMALSADGRRIVSGLRDSSVTIWDISKGTRALEPLRGHQETVWSVAVSPDGTRIASGSEDRTIIIWHAGSGSIIAGPLHGHTSSIPGLAFSPDGSCLVSGSEDHTIRTWDGHDGTWRKLFTGHGDCVMSVVFSPDGKRIASGSDDRTVRLWDPYTCTTIAGPFVGHTDWIDCIAFSPDGQRIVSSSQDRTMRVWNSYSGEMVAGPFEGHTGRVKSVAFSPDGSRVVSGSYDRTVCVWDSYDGRILAGPFDGHRQEVNAVLFSADGTRVYSGAEEGRIRVWDASGGTADDTEVSGHAGSIKCVAFSPDGIHAASGSSDHTICIWDAHSGALLAGPLAGHSGRVLSVEFSPDGKSVVSGSDDCTLRAWDASTGTLLAGPFKEHTGHVWATKFSPDGSRIASGSTDCTIRLWDPLTSIPTTGPFNGHTSSVSSIAFSLDGSLVTSGSLDATVRMWRASDGELVWTSDAHSAAVWCVALLPDGKRVVSGSQDGVTFVLDAHSGVVLHRPFTGPTCSAWPLACSPDGGAVVSVILDQLVQVWEVQSGNMVAGPLRISRSKVASVAFSPDGAHIILGSVDGTIRIWDRTATRDPNTTSPGSFFINDDGWLVNSHLQRLLWVPADLRNGFRLPNPFTPTVINGGCTTRLDTELLVGNRWRECYNASQK